MFKRWGIKLIFNQLDHIAFQGIALKPRQIFKKDFSKRSNVNYPSCIVFFKECHHYFYSLAQKILKLMCTDLWGIRKKISGGRWAWMRKSFIHCISFKRYFVIMCIFFFWNAIYDNSINYNCYPKQKSHTVF